MPPYCEEHSMYHSLIWGLDECDRMRAADRREAKVAALREKAERIAQDEIDAYAENLTPDEEADFRPRAEVWRDLITAAALAALTEKENA